MFFICSSYVLVLADAGFLPLAPASYLSHDSRDSVVSTLVDLTHLKNYTESTDSALPLLVQR